MEAPENDVSKAILNASIKVHKTLGAGLFESVYEGCLAHELEQLGYKVLRQVPVAVKYGDLKFEGGFKIDLLVNDCVIVELKSVSFNILLCILCSLAQARSAHSGSTSTTMCTAGSCCITLIALDCG